MFVMHALPGLGWAAVRFVRIALFLLTIVFLQVSVPALTRPLPARQL